MYFIRQKVAFKNLIFEYFGFFLFIYIIFYQHVFHQLNPGTTPEMAMKKLKNL